MLHTTSLITKMLFFIHFFKDVYGSHKKMMSMKLMVDFKKNMQMVNFNAK